MRIICVHFKRLLKWSFQNHVYYGKLLLRRPCAPDASHLCCLPLCAKRTGNHRDGRPCRIRNYGCLYVCLCTSSYEAVLLKLILDKVCFLFVRRTHFSAVLPALPVSLDPAFWHGLGRFPHISYKKCISPHPFPMDVLWELPELDILLRRFRISDRYRLSGAS